MNNPQNDSNSKAPQDSTATPAADGKNPLDALEELLNQAKQGSGNAENVTASAEAQQAADQQAAKAKAEAELQQMAAQSQKTDSDMLEKQRQALEEIKTTPEYQARVSQMEEKEEEQAKEQDKQDGYGIQQLEHKKI